MNERERRDREWRDAITEAGDDTLGGQYLLYPKNAKMFLAAREDDWRENMDDLRSERNRWKDRYERLRDAYGIARGGRDDWGLVDHVLDTIKAEIAAPPPSE